MASIEEGGDSGHKKGPGVKKAKKLSTRVDMTPMVDLGFLLITFFIFTTTMSTPSTTKLNMPKDTKKEEEQNKAKASGALTILLGKDNHVFYYEGELDDKASNFKTSTFKEIRQEIIDKRNDVIKNHIHDESCAEIQQKWHEKYPKDPNWKDACRDRDFVVIIKPNDDATYKNTVDILDEMSINGVKRYAMIDITPLELGLIQKTEGTSK